jgi:hypothetical protein
LRWLPSPITTTANPPQPPRHLTLAHALLEQLCGFHPPPLQSLKVPPRGVSCRRQSANCITQAGGRKIGRTRGDPEWLWIDTYSAIKTTAINAVFVCHIKQPGDDPEFQLRINGTRAQSYNADGLTDALGEWHAITSRAAAEG